MPWCFAQFRRECWNGWVLNLKLQSFILPIYFLITLTMILWKPFETTFRYEIFGINYNSTVLNNLSKTSITSQPNEYFTSLESQNNNNLKASFYTSKLLFHKHFIEFQMSIYHEYFNEIFISEVQRVYFYARNKITKSISYWNSKSGFWHVELSKIAWPIEAYFWLSGTFFLYNFWLTLNALNLNCFRLSYFLLLLFVFKGLMKNLQPTIWI